jgi:hypothetical protein
MNGIYTLREPAQVPVTQWFKDGDHPSVKAQEGQRYGVIITRLGPKKVHPGEFIVKESAGIFKVFKEKAFHQRFKSVSE